MELSRHKRRILLVQAIFLWEQNQDKDPESLLHYIWEEFSPTSYANDLNDFDKDRFFGMIQELPKLQQTLTKHAPEWPLEKIASNDRAVLYLGIYELLHTDVPAPVVINEAVELAKAFGGQRSSQFINGVLSSINKELRDSKKIQP